MTDFDQLNKTLTEFRVDVADRLGRIEQSLADRLDHADRIAALERSHSFYRGATRILGALWAALTYVISHHLWSNGGH